MYYEAKVRHSIFTDSGEAKEVKETVLTNCDLFAEAELAGLNWCNNDGDVIAIRRSDVTEIVNEKELNFDFDYYKVKVADIYKDDNGNEKELLYVLLVNAKDTQDANKKVLEHLKMGMSDFAIKSVTLSKIIEIIP